MKTHIAACSILLAVAGCTVDDELDDADVTEATDPLLLSPTSKSFAGQVHFDGGCTGTVLTEHWILTAAHCMGPTGSIFWDDTIYGAQTSDGVQTVVYRGPVQWYRHNLYSGSGYKYDIGLAYLLGYGIDTASVGRSVLYADARKPWRDNSFTAGVVSGFGKGSPPGGTASCDSGTTANILRALAVSITGYDSDFAVRVSARTCGGDSGMPYYYRPTTTGAVQHLQVGVHHGTFPSTGTGMGALLPPNLAWVESWLRNKMPHKFQFSSTTGTANGWAYKKYSEANTVVGQVTRQPGWCLTATSAAQAAPIVVSPCDGRWTQAWWLTPTGEMRSFANTGLCLDVQYADPSIGNGLWLWPCAAAGSLNEAQRFRVEAYGNIRSGLDYDRCLELPGNSAYDGAAVRIAHCGYIDAQTWTL